jgi:hypothetical protein
MQRCAPYDRSECYCSSLCNPCQGSLCAFPTMEDVKDEVHAFFFAVILLLPGAAQAPGRGRRKIAVDRQAQLGIAHYRGAGRTSFRRTRRCSPRAHYIIIEVP